MIETNNNNTSTNRSINNNTCTPPLLNNSERKKKKRMSFVDETTTTKNKVKVLKRNHQLNIKNSRLRKPLQDDNLLKNYFEWDKEGPSTGDLTVYKMFNPTSSSTPSTPSTPTLQSNNVLSNNHSASTTTNGQYSNQKQGLFGNNTEMTPPSPLSLSSSSSSSSSYQNNNNNNNGNNVRHRNNGRERTSNSGIIRRVPSASLLTDRVVTTEKLHVHQSKPQQLPQLQRTPQYPPQSQPQPVFEQSQPTRQGEIIAAFIPISDESMKNTTNHSSNQLNDSHTQQQQQHSNTTNTINNTTNNTTTHVHPHVEQHDHATIHDVDQRHEQNNNTTTNTLERQDEQKQACNETCQTCNRLNSQTVQEDEHALTSDDFYNEHFDLFNNTLMNEHASPNQYYQCHESSNNESGTNGSIHSCNTRESGNDDEEYNNFINSISNLFDQ